MQTGARDRRLIYAASFLRALAHGLAGVLLGIYLAKLGLSLAAIGAVLSAGIAGVAVATFAVTFYGDRLGRRRTLAAFSVVTACGGLAAALISDPLLIGVAAFVGMLSGMGKDRGAMLVLESAIIPATVNDAGRTRAFAWYSVLQDVGQALGGLLAALPELLSSAGFAGETESFRAAVIVYALLCAASLPLYARLSARSEAPARGSEPRLSAASRSVLWKISALFAVDGVGGGLIGSALFSFFFYQQFGVSAAAISILFLLGRGMSAASHLVAAWLAGRIGLVNTMVFTHIPSSLLLVAIPFAGTYWIAAALYLAREGLAEMDVPTRQSYVMAMVQPAERTFASGVTSLARMCAWAVAPVMAGLAMQTVALATPLFIAAGMKIGYDLLLWGAFRNLKPPEES